MRSRAQLRLTFACRRKTDTEEPNSVEKGTHRRKVPVPVRVCFAGASARWRFCPPGRHRSTEDRVRPRAQLRLTIACRRETDTEEPNSVEKGTHRRKVPVPVRVCFAGAGTRWKYCPPIRIRSPEDRLRIRAQLRLTFACRRKWIPKSSTPLRRALTGGRHQFLLGFVLSELMRGGDPVLRRVIVRLRTGCESALCSG